jgi:murein L,D-transpeptidase YcbB/YkuD
VDALESDRPRTGRLWLAVLAGSLFAVGSIMAFAFFAGRGSVADAGAVPVSTASASPSSSVPTSSPTTTANSSKPASELSGVNTNSPTFNAQAADFICHTVTAKKGVVGPSVQPKLVTARAQWILVRSGYDPGPIDGVYTTRTIDAIKAFQNDHGLSSNGLISAKTWNAFEQSYCNGPVVPIPALDTLLKLKPNADQFSSSAQLILCSATQLPALSETAKANSGALLLQWVLSQYAGESLTVNGIFGPDSTDAVKRYQTQRQLADDGLVGPATWAALRHDVCGDTGALSTVTPSPTAS